MNELPREVKIELLKAREKGVQFPKNYIPPYNIRSASTIGRTPFDFSWEKGQDPWDANGYNGWKSANKPVFAVYFGDNRFSGWFWNDEGAAKSYRNKLNIRHFKIASLSENPLNPVLI